MPVICESKGTKLPGKSFGHALIARKCFVAFAALFLIVSVVGESFAQKLELSEAGNPDPQALDYGIIFHSSVPMSTRKLIVDDLVWLYSLGPLRDSELFNKLGNITSSDIVTGTDIVAWILARVQFISMDTWCFNKNRIVVSGIKPDIGLRIFNVDPDACPIDTSGDPYLADAEPFFLKMDYSHWRQADEFRKELDGISADGNVLLFLSGKTLTAPIVQITNLFSILQTQYPNAQRVERLATIIHESKHIEGGHKHIRCREWSSSPVVRLSYLLSISSEKEVSAAQKACDTGFDGAYAFHTAFLRMMVSNCKSCSVNEAGRLKRLEIGYWARLVILLKQPVIVPDEIIHPDTKNLRGREITSVPPKILFFAAQEYALLDKQACKKNNPGNACLAMQRQEAEIYLIREFMEGIERRNGFLGNWSDLTSLDRSIYKKPADGRWAAAWITRVQSAEASGYNLPMKWMRPCSQFEKGCPSGN